jgi:UDP-N-acetylglucosamine--N-acetylmuramyl-(pentapeptide) pyrophosphoryl-undecaprenol N-acetylglucosamine transferase
VKPARRHRRRRHRRTFLPAEALAASCAGAAIAIALMTDARSGGLASPAFEGCERFVLSGAGIAGRGLLAGGRRRCRRIAAGTLRGAAAAAPS